MYLEGPYPGPTCFGLAKTELQGPRNAFLSTWLSLISRGATDFKKVRHSIYSIQLMPPATPQRPFFVKMSHLTQNKPQKYRSGHFGSFDKFVKMKQTSLLHMKWSKLVCLITHYGYVLAREAKGKKIKKPLHHQKLGLQPKTPTDQGGVNAPLMGIELATILVRNTTWQNMYKYVFGHWNTPSSQCFRDY